MKKRYLWLAGTIVFAISFLLLFLGVHSVLEQPVNTQNILAFALLSAIFAGISAAFYALQMRAAFFIFLAGLITGFFIMLTQFINGVAGWGDLIGLLSLFFITGIGLIGGLFVQFIWFLIKRGRQSRIP